MPPIWGVPNGGGADVYGSQDLVLSTSAPYTTVTIRSADGSYTKTVAVTSTGATIVSLPLSVVMSDQVNTKELNKGLIITSGEPVQVTYRLTPNLNQDIVPLKCRAALGYAFYAGSQTRLSGNNIVNERHFVSVMATLDGTSVTFNSPIDLEGHPANVPFTITLNAGQTYMVTSKVINNGASTENKSVAGTLVTSDPDHPIVVNSGSQHTAQPYSSNRDAGIDQLVPARTVGTDYVAVHSLNTAANSDYVFVVAIENNTTVTISGPTTVAGTSSVLATTTLQAGQVYTYNLPNAAQNRAFYIKTGKKAYTYHVSSYAQNEFGMGLLPAINPCNGSKRIDFFRTTAVSNDQALVTIPSSGTASLTFRGQPFSAYGTVIDRITVNGVQQSIISFPNSSIASVDNVNTLTSTERFHVGVVSNTGGASTGNYGYYSNYEARVDVINGQSGQPDDFITVAQVTVGSPVDYCLTLTSCGNTNTIKSILPGKYTKSATFNGRQCITYTMSTTAPICARDTIRVIVQNELGREGQVCLEYVNNNNDLIVSILSSSSIVCQPTGSVSLTVVPISSGGNFRYEWITPDKQVLTTKILQGAVPGRYLVSVSDGNTCTDTTSIVVKADTPTVKFTGTSAGSTSFCAGTSVPYTLSASAGTYTWSATNGTITSGGAPTSQTATVRWGSAGTGTLRAVVTSANGCTAAVTQTVALQAAPVLSFSVQNAACFGQATGLVNLTPSGGTTPYTYRWSNGTTSEDLTSVTSGAYSVTVTDRGGCIASGSATVGQSTTISIASSVTGVLCNSRNTGAISLSVSGGAPSYRYSWTNGGSTLAATTPAMTGITAGTYGATVTDANGCVGSLTVVVTQPPAITLALTQQDVACTGAATGSISLTATGGTGAFTYKWTGPTGIGTTTKDLSGLVAGTYSVTVTDANGCTATTSATIQQPLVLALSTTRVNPVCNGAGTGSIDLSVSGGTAGYVYRWVGPLGTGPTTQDLSALVAGTYSVTVTDASGCQSVTAVTLTQPLAVSVSVTQQDVSCFGGNNGSLSLSPVGATAPFTYAWAGPVGAGAATRNLASLVAGAYSVTVTDANQCSVVQSYSITQPAALSLTAVRQQIACNGASSGNIDLTVSGGKSPFLYAWSNGATTQDIMTLPAGSYSVVVTDANNCVVTQTFSLTQPSIILPALAKQNVACNGAATGSITLAPTGGTGAYTYLWMGPVSNGATTQNLTGLVAGTYSVVVTDFTGCTATASAILTQPTAITLTAAGQNPACFGADNGGIDLTVSGGTSAYSYLWAGGQTTQNLSALVAGAYSVTVTDANACRAVLSTTLTNPPALSVVTAGQNPACFGASTGSIGLTVAGGTRAYTYRWNTGGTTASISGLVAGTYSVTVSDANSCSLVRSVTLTNPPALTLTATKQNPVCFGTATGSITLAPAGGTGTYTYLWTGPASNGATTKNLTTIPAGTYQVTVTDASGCSQTLTTTLTNPPALTLALAPVSVACNGAATGLVSLTTTGGTGTYTYRWSNGSTNQLLAAVAAGAYSVTVADANGCVAQAQATLGQPPALTVSLLLRPVSCFGGADGGVGQLVQGGTGAYSYRWSNGSSTSLLAGITAGTYSLTVTDANGCTGTATTTVTQPTALSLTATTQQVSCFGGVNGVINATPSGGTAPYSFSWSDGSSAEDVLGLTAGTYSLTVTDANACSVTISRSLTQPPGLTATQSHTNVSCTNGGNGAIDLTPGGGVAPYTYLWSTGATTQALSGLTSNTYTVTITDANGCQLAASVPITQPIPLTIQPDPSLVLCNAQPASVVTDTRGGTSPYSYRWNTGATTASVYGLSAGSYSVVVTDVNGCTATTSATIVEPPPFGVAASVTAVACNNQSTGVISLKIEGATPPYALTMTNAANTVVSNSTLTTGLPAGSYIIKVVDSNSCVQSTTIAITEPPELTLAALATDVLCYGDQQGVISLTATGGRMPFAFAWAGPMGNATTQNLTNLSAGSYSVVVTDANGCTATTTRSVTQPPLLTLGASYDDVTCFGGNDGQITVSPAGGTLPYSYSWTGPVGNNQTTATHSNLIAGVYSVTVTDANGCSDELRVTIAQPSALSVAVFADNLTCFQNASGKIELAVAGGTLPYAYSWAGPTGNGASTQNRSGLAAGIYSVTVTDGHGCSEIRSVTLTEPALLTLTSTTQPVVCFGNATGSISLTVSGGTGQPSFAWSDGGTTKDRSGLIAGAYSVSVTDANQCVASQSFTITQPPALTSAASSLSVACFAGTTGSINLTATGGTAPYSYSWNDGSTLRNRAGVAAGNYLVVVTDANGCQTSNNVTLTQPTPLVVALTPVPARCFGSADGSVSANVQGGAPAYTYVWATGATASLITTLIAGTYSVTVTDANSCTAQALATVLQPTALTITGAQTNILCNGGTNGQANITASGGTGPYVYLWTTGAMTSAIDNVPAGVYTVTVTDANGCVQVNSFTLTQPPALSVAVSGTNISCFGGTNGTASLTASGGVGPYTYQWISPSGARYAAPEISVLRAGVYSVTVTDANQCSAQTSLTLTQPDALTGRLNGLPISCYGGSDGQLAAIVGGGTSPYAYSWMDVGLSSPNRMGLASNTYAVNVTDAQGCRLTLIESLTQPIGVVLMMHVVPPRCNGSADGIVSATALGGTPAVGTAAYRYSWDTGIDAQTLSSLQAGTYAVTATDANGCTATVSALVDEPASLTLTATTVDILCFGGKNGQINIDLAGGTLPYSYAWAGPASSGAFTPTLTNLPAGVYSLTVTDANDCALVRSFTLTEPPVLSLVTNTQNVACFNGSAGTVSLTAVGGAPAGGSEAYEFVWNTGARTADLTALPAGVYSVTVTDANQCTATTSVTVTQPLALSINAAATNITCFSGADGAISLTVAGGTQPFSYSWTDGATEADRSSLSAGLYQGVVTDANGCQIALARTLTQPDLLRLQINMADVSCFGGSDGALSVVVTGGETPLSTNQPYTYLWTGPTGVIGTSTSSVTGLVAGTYMVTVTNASQCSQIISATIGQPSAMSVTGTATPASCAGGHDGALSLTVMGGTPLYGYAWAGPSGNGVTTPDQSSLVAGLYSVTAIDKNGCSAQLSLSVTEPPQLTIAMAMQNNRCNGDTTGRAEATVTGGTGPYSYTWTGGESTTALSTTNVLQNVVAGSYTLFVADANACRDTITITLTQPLRIAVETSLTHVSCFGGADGAIRSTLTGGTPGSTSQPYNYTWKTSSLGILPTTPTQQGLSADAYVLRVTDANNCPAEFVVSIGQPDALSMTGQVSPARCFGTADGAIRVTASGGKEPYRYVWQNTTGTQVASTSIPSGLVADIYSVTLIDANDCSLIQSYTVTEPPAMSITGTSNQVACFSGADGTIGLTVAGGIPGPTSQPYTYAWSNGQSASTLAGLTAGAYSVTVTDGTSCSTTSSFTVGQATSLSVVNIITDAHCFSGTDGRVSLTTTGGTLPYLYLWSTGASTSAIDGLTAGVYSVSISDGNGCSIQTSFSVSQPMALSMSATILPVSCADGHDGSASLTVVGGVNAPNEPYTYAWSNGQSVSGVSGLSAGTYSVTVTDGNGCTLARALTVTEPVALSLAASVTDVRCFSGTDGTASLTVSGGTLPYSYSWSNGQSTSLLSGLSAGLYSVMVVDGNGCSMVSALTVSQPAALSLIGRQTNVNCSGSADGTISLTISGGTSSSGTFPYTYAWVNDDASFMASTSMVSGLAAGAYSVTVTDANGCNQTDRFVIEQPDLLTVSGLPTSVSCAGQPATVTTEVRGGAGPYSYSWSNGTTTATVVSLTAGTYSLTVTDTNGCTASAAISVVQPPPFGVNAIVKPVICNGSATGSINVTLEGATPGPAAQPYSYSWSTGVVTEDLANLAAGTYSLTVTDANECREVVSFTLTQADDLTLTAQASAPNCSGPTPRQDGQLLLTNFDSTWRFAISEGERFTAVIADPGTLPVVPADGVLRRDLPNPGRVTGQPYTVRIYTPDGCSKDLTVILPPADCVCKPDICAPVRIQKTKGR
ncbi:hypothetical protein [Fibrella forsythiae]|uniref:PKD/Chitinase domain-containing protein n=1 Tax=Fibrella forsythiae TaxID=2817061 RepID=A0ABS3JJE8_9BACT|nr:hypothetical protein [Fibrella forsythiae]MBO0950121.1 hypothetical protein [Fibrella forsythiae]